MDRISQFRKCRCGYSIIVYIVESVHDEPLYYHYFDGHSGDYKQVFVCPGCHDRLNYETLEG